MPLTRDFKELVQKQAQENPKFRRALLQEAIEAFLSGDVATGKAVLRDYVNATIGFQELSELTDTSPKSLMRMLGPTGNPRSATLFDVLAHLQTEEGVHYTLKERK